MIYDWVKQALREPLVHFLGIGSALFLLMGQITCALSRPRPDDKRLCHWRHRLYVVAATRPTGLSAQKNIGLEP